MMKKFCLIFCVVCFACTTSYYPPGNLSSHQLDGFYLKMNAENNLKKPGKILFWTGVGFLGCSVLSFFFSPYVLGKSEVQVFSTEVQRVALYTGYSFLGSGLASLVTGSVMYVEGVKRWNWADMAVKAKDIKIEEDSE